MRDALGAGQEADRQSLYVGATAVRLTHAFLLALNARSLESR